MQIASFGYLRSPVEFRCDRCYKKTRLSRDDDLWKKNILFGFAVALAPRVTPRVIRKTTLESVVAR